VLKQVRKAHYETEVDSNCAQIEKLNQQEKDEHEDLSWLIGFPK
jgi:hypothetical protein